MTEPTTAALKRRVVWKFSLRAAQLSVAMPKYAKIIHVGVDPVGDCPALWALVSPDQEVESRNFVVVGTGSDTPESCIHIGSLIHGRLVWHIFETTEMQVLAEMFGAFSGR